MRMLGETTCEGSKFWLHRIFFDCHIPLNEECPKHHGHKWDLGMTSGTCGNVGEKTQLMLVWMNASGAGIASHPQRLGVTKKTISMSYGVLFLECLRTP